MEKYIYLKKQNNNNKKTKNKKNNYDPRKYSTQVKAT